MKIVSAPVFNAKSKFCLSFQSFYLVFTFLNILSYFPTKSYINNSQNKIFLPSGTVSSRLELWRRNQQKLKQQIMLMSHAEVIMYAARWMTRLSMPTKDVASYEMRWRAASRR